MRAKGETVLGGEKVTRWVENYVYVTSDTEYCPIRKKEEPFSSITVIGKRNLPYFTE
jgi:hypothetical protein